MHTLFLTPITPYPPISGGQKVSLAYLEQYARHGPVDLIGFYEQSYNWDLKAIRAELGRLCRRVDLFPMAIHYRQHRLRHALLGARSLLGPTPFRLRKFLLQPAIERVRALRPADYDLVHCDFLHMSGYLSLIPGPPVILAEHNVEWQIFERHAGHAANPLIRAFAWYEARRLRRYEVARLSRASHVLTLSDDDTATLRAAGVSAPMTVMPFPAEPRPVARFHQGHPAIISLGNLSAPGRAQGTRWFHSAVWPRLRQLVPGIRWHIVGAGAGPDIEAMHTGADLIVHGFLNDADLGRLLAQVQACVVPLFIGGGIRIKIIDMLSLGIPCVSTRVGAQGFTCDAVLVQDDPHGFADDLSRILGDANLWYHLSTAGIDYIRRHHSSDALRARFDPVLESVYAPRIEGARSIHGENI